MREDVSGGVTRAEFEELARKVWEEEIFPLIGAGQREYAHDESDALANFERVGAQLELTREGVLLVYLLKHIDGIVAHVRGHTSQREPVQGRISDAIVYLLLLRAMADA